MPDYSYGNLQRPNTQMMQYGMQMLQPRPPGYQNLPFYSGGPQPQMQTLPYSGGQGQLEELASPPSGKRRIRIGNKTYVEEDDTAAAPSTQIGSRSY
jgi:hypothetical protein